jgi:hypothetical protein
MHLEWFAGSAIPWHKGGADEHWKRIKNATPLLQVRALTAAVIQELHAAAA